MKLAWFTPLPPTKSGVAWYNLELLPGLASTHQIDVFVDGSPDRFTRPDARTVVRNAHDFVWKHFREPYELVVYQLGNSPYHDYIWPYLVRYPGLVVLHDGQLHHARARALLQQGRSDDYRREFSFNHPGLDPKVAESGVAGLLGPATYLWPMLRIAVESARLLVVHNDWLAHQLLTEHPSARIDVVDMGVPDPSIRADAGEIVRARHDIPADAVVFAALGKVTPEKCISKALVSLAAIQKNSPACHLLLVGEGVEHYDAEAEARALGVEARVTVTGFVPEEQMAGYLAAADVCLCLRWPTSRETSASWLRCLAAGRPTVITDLAHLGDIPVLDPRTWCALYMPPAADAQRSLDPVAVSIDIIDFEHSLGLAMRRLATDVRLRESLGRAARELWKARFTLDGMVSGYLRGIAAAVATPSAAVHRSGWPAHLLMDGTEFVQGLLSQMAMPDDRIQQVWRPTGHPAVASAHASDPADDHREPGL